MKYCNIFEYNVDRFILLLARRELKKINDRNHYILTNIMFMDPSFFKENALPITLGNTHFVAFKKRLFYGQFVCADFKPEVGFYLQATDFMQFDIFIYFLNFRYYRKLQYQPQFFCSLKS